MPRCKTCKEKFEPKVFNQKHCMTNDICINAEMNHKIDLQKKSWRKEKKERKEMIKTKSDYEKDLEKLFNEFIRLRDAECKCISCDALEGTYKLTAGHFYPAGSYKNLRFHEDNVHSQCWWNCNMKKSGNLLEYRPRLINKIGIEKVEELDRLRNIPRHYTILELKEMIIEYRAKVKELKKS